VDNLTEGVDNLTEGVDNLTEGVDNLTEGVDNLTEGVDSVAGHMIYYKKTWTSPYVHTTNKYTYSNQLQYHNNDICYNLQL